MPYDQSLDEEIYKDTASFETTRVNVAVYSYNGGERKIQITRENLDQNENWRFNKLGRMNREELAGVLPFINKALEQM